MTDIIKTAPFGRVSCTSCGMTLRNSEIAYYESSSLFGSVTEHPTTPGSGHGGVGPPGAVGTVLCEYCFSAQYETGSNDESWRDFDELVDISEMEYWDSMLDHTEEYE